MALRICFLLARRSTKKERMFSDYTIRMLNLHDYLNLLHSRLSDNRLLDNGINVHLVLLGHRLTLILGLTSKLQSVRAEEVRFGVDLTNSLLLNTLNLLSSSSSYTICQKNVFIGSIIGMESLDYLEYSLPL